MTLFRFFLVTVAAIAITGHGQDLSNPQPEVDDLTLPMPNGLEMVFRPIYLGIGASPFAIREFTMGSPAGEDFRETPIKVQLGGSFIGEKDGKSDWLYYLGKYEVTEDQFNAVVSSGVGVPAAVGSLASGSLPKTNMTWLEVEEFLQRYNLWLFANARVKMAHLDHRDPSLGFVRLPTEAEWEFAARGGSAVDRGRFEQRTPYEGPLERYEWFGGPSSSHDKLKAIGLLAANPLGVHDMLGNAAELVSQLYQIEYLQGRTGGLVVRGGNFRSSEGELRSSSRMEQPLYSADLQPARSETIGFRIVLATPIFTSIAGIRDAEAAWPEYAKSRVSPMSAALSTATVAEQTSVALKDIDGILSQLEVSLGGRSHISEAAQAELDLIRSSFGNIEANIRNGDETFAEGGVTLASVSSWAVQRAIAQIPLARRLLERAKTPEERESSTKELADVEANIADARRKYELACNQLARISSDVVSRKFDAWIAELNRRNIPGQAHATKVAETNMANYLRTKRLDLNQWMKDLSPETPP